MQQHDGIVCMQRVLAVLGDRWTAVILYCLANETSVRFGKLEEASHGINPRTLSARLLQLEQHGVVEKIRKPSSRRTEYRLTPMGEDLLPTVIEMHNWWHRHHPHSIQ